MPKSDDGPLVKALEFERDGEVIDTMKISPPVGTYSTRLERIMSGVLIQAADDILVFEVGTDGERIDYG